MGIKEMTLLLIMTIFIFICCSTSAASTTHLADNPSLDSYEGGRGIANQSKFGHGGGGGGRSGGGGHGEANGDRSHTPASQGGSNAIPVYAAGAANNHHPNNHHGGGDCRHGSIRSAVLAATILESLLLYIYKDF